MIHSFWAESPPDILTHGIYSIKVDEVDSYIEQIQEQIKSIDGATGRWQKILTDFNLFISIPLATIFEIENSFDTFTVKLFERS